MKTENGMPRLNAGDHRARLVFRRLSSAMLGAACATCLGAHALAAEELTGSVTVYGWLPWLDADVTSRRGGVSANTSVSAGDVLDALKFAFMAAGEVHYGRFGLLHDVIYSSLGNDGTLSGPLAANVSVDTELLIVTTAFGYQIYAQNGLLVEPFAGARYIDISSDVSIDGGGPVGVSRNASADVNWWDPVIGLRARMPLTEHLSLAGYGLIGGFGAGSQFTWEVFTGLDYALSDRISANAGFRYLSIDYEGDNADVNMDQYGPLLGLTVRF